jgi:hypothetical protein
MGICNGEVVRMRNHDCSGVECDSGWFNDYFVANCELLLAHAGRVAAKAGISESGT